MQTREELVDTLSYLYRGISSIEKLQAQKQNIYAQINAYRSNIAQQKSRENMAMKGSALNVNKGKNTAGNVVLIIGGVLVAIYLLFSSLIRAIVQDIEGIGFLFWMFLIILLLIIFGIFMAVRGATGAIGKKITQVSANAVPDARNKMNYANEQIENLALQIPDIDSKMAISYSYIEDLVKNFPPNYCYSEAIGKCLFYINNQRADSIKEALNLYEDENYKERMLLEQKKQTSYAAISAAANVQTAYNTGRTAEYAKQIADNTADIANSNRVIAASMQAVERYSAATASNTAAAANNAAATSGYVRNIRDRVCPSFWD